MNSYHLSQMNSFTNFRQPTIFLSRNATNINLKKMVIEGLNVERRMLVYYKIIIVIEDSTVLRTNIPHYLMNIIKIETIEHTMKEVVFTENWV